MLSQKEEIQKILHQKFPQLAEKALQEEIAEIGQIMDFAPGEVIMDYGSYIRMVPLIIEGSIKVTREDDTLGKELLLYFINAGDTCSMSFTCCMMDKKSAIRTEAMERTRLIGIPVKYVDGWMSKYQSWKNFVMTSYDHKMLELVRVIDKITFKGLDERMEKYLKALTKSLKNNTVNITHQQIADDLNVSREAVSRLLKKLESIERVKLGRNQITFLD
ncbi:MAG: Crp/Fnr family transcriptional regulator [Saprospiraceae bacterium]